MIQNTADNKNINSFVIANFGNVISFGEFDITPPITIVDANINPPTADPNDINAPSNFPPALELDSKSGAPFAKAINVTAANVGDNPNLSERSYIPTAKYLSAMPATHMNKIGKKKQIKINIKIAFLSVCL